MVHEQQIETIAEIVRDTMATDSPWSSSKAVAGILAAILLPASAANYLYDVCQELGFSEVRCPSASSSSRCASSSASLVTLEPWNSSFRVPSKLTR